MNAPEKEGKDCGLGRIVGDHMGRDEAAWNDPRNFDHGIAKVRPFDGTESTAWDALLSKGIRVDMNQKSANVNTSCKDE